MRLHGNLTRWNDQRGFGFITPAGGGSEIFVHVSAFPHDGKRPRVDELISFEVEAGPDGRQRAVRVMRRAERPTNAGSRVPKSVDHRRSWLAGLLMVPLLGGAAVYGYHRYSAHRAATLMLLEQAKPQELDASGFSCDGRRFCSEMHSCEEARYFLRHCPKTRMDGDHDGIPCEDQCGH